MQVLSVGPDAAATVLTTRVLSVQPSVVITIDVLHLVFSAFGFVCKIATFEKQAGFQALIQYQDSATADTVSWQRSIAERGPADTDTLQHCHPPTCLNLCPLSAQVRAALDGRHIPKNLLGNTPHPPQLKISFSQHTDLNVKFQSHRSRQARPLCLCHYSPCALRACRTLPVAA